MLQTSAQVSGTYPKRPGLPLGIRLCVGVVVLLRDMLFGACYACYRGVVAVDTFIWFRPAHYHGYRKEMQIEAGISVLLFLTCLGVTPVTMIAAFQQPQIMPKDSISQPWALGILFGPSALLLSLRVPDVIRWLVLGAAKGLRHVAHQVKIRMPPG